MTRHLTVILAIVSIGGLTALTLQFSRTTDAGSADRALPAVSVSVPTIGPPPVGACRPADERSLDGQQITLSGACAGVISQPLTCSEGEEALIGSTDSAVDSQHDLVLVAIIPDFIGARTYSRGMLFAQVAGANGMSRWTNRETTITMDRTGIIHLPQSELAPEPGTSTVGSLTLEGSLECR